MKSQHHRPIIHMEASDCMLLICLMSRRDKTTLSIHSVLIPT